MPSVKKNESKSSYMKRCVPQVIAEGKKKSQAIAQCLGMHKSKWSSKKK
jgi:hypothetical protein